MKNQRFLIVTILVAIVAFGAAAFFMNSQKSAELDTAPEAWVFEVLHRTDSFSVGPADAPITLVEFFDPECEACRAVAPLVKQIQSEYSGRIRTIYRYMPFHGNSLYAAALLEEARAQGKYEAVLESFFENQPAWGDHHAPKPELLPGLATKAGVDLGKHDKEALILKHRSIVDRDQGDGYRLLVRATPTFFVNGRMVFDLGYEPIKAAIERALSEKKN